MKEDKKGSSGSGISLPSILERSWNRLVQWARPRDIRLVYSPLYLVDLGATPIDVLRGERILAFLLASGLLHPSKLLGPEVASLRDLRLAHGRRYLDSLRRPESLNEIVGSAVWPDLHRKALMAQRAAVGGTILSTRHALERRNTVVNLGGGFHHAGRFQGGGFCIFNDVAVAIADARREGFEGSILIIDLDLHDGNGTREIFARDESVFTFSVHNETWSKAPAVASRSIELGADVVDSDYLAILDQHVPKLLAEVEPRLVFYLAGTDVAADDRLGNWQISARGMLARDQQVLKGIRRSRPETPTVVLLAGGYGSETWRYSARFLAWLLSGREGIEPPSTADITIARYRHLSKELRSSHVPVHSERDDDWHLTEEDVLGTFGAAASRSLFLGRWSHHAVELTLEWTGILDRIRQMGFAHPSVDFDLDNPAGHTVRLFGDSRRQELLIEVRLRLDRGSIAGLELLSLEWMLMQNPRATFSEGQSPLPGQTYPGLGLGSDIISLLLLIGDRLELDGIIFVPSQYHLAVRSRRYLKLLQPEDEGWFRALQRSLGELSLAEATSLVASGGVRDKRSGEELTWRPMQMVLPISDRLHDMVEGAEYEARASASAAMQEFEPAGGDALKTSRPDPGATS